MNFRYSIVTAAASAACITGYANPERQTSHAENVLPDIVFILADDLGYGDISCFNEEGKIPTPNVDRLSREGVVFTEAHSGASVSTPTRYGILTGRYCWRSYLKRSVLPFYHEPLVAPDRTTMASMLRNQGYSTACIGKWHLGFNYPTTDGKRPIDTESKYNLDFRKEITGGPVDVGFDYFFGVDCPNFPPYCFIENRHTLGIPEEYIPKSVEMDYRGGRGIKGWKLEEVLPGVGAKAVEYINEAAKKDNPFFLYFPLTSPHTPIVPAEEFRNATDLNEYADFVAESDAIIGDVLDALDRNGLSDNTIVVFTSDNGCSPQADFDFLEQKGHDPSYTFRGMKTDLFEGGHHIPCVVRWPARFTHHIVDEMICLTDFFATFAELTGYEMAPDEGEDSFSLLPLLETSDAPAVRPDIVHHSSHGYFAIREGRWKLLMASYSGGWSEPKRPVKGGAPYQLYDMEKDPGETTNLYEVYPDVARRLAATLAEQILNGRSTPGIPQKNDVEKPWPQISWISDPALGINSK